MAAKVAPIGFARVGFPQFRRSSHRITRSTFLACEANKNAMRHQLSSNQSAPCAVPLFSWSCVTLFPQAPLLKDIVLRERDRIAFFPRPACSVFSITCRLFFLSWPSFFTPVPLFSVACRLFCKNRGGGGYRTQRGRGRSGGRAVSARGRMRNRGPSGGGTFRSDSPQHGQRPSSQNARVASARSQWPRASHCGLMHCTVKPGRNCISFPHWP